MRLSLLWGVLALPRGLLALALPGALLILLRKVLALLEGLVTPPRGVLTPGLLRRLLILALLGGVLILALLEGLLALILPEGLAIAGHPVLMRRAAWQDCCVKLRAVWRGCCENWAAGCGRRWC